MEFKVKRRSPGETRERQESSDWGGQTLTDALFDSPKKQLPALLSSKEERRIALAKQKASDEMKARVADRKRNQIIVAKFGLQAPKIIKMIEMEDSDAAITLLKKNLLQTTIDLIPLAEDNIRETESRKGVYQYTALINTARELMVDIQADYDKGKMVMDITDRVIRPILMDIAQEVITSHHDFKGKVDDLLLPECKREFSQKLQNLATEMAKQMTKKFHEAREKLSQLLSG